MSQLGEPLPAFAELQELNRAIPVALAHFRPESRGSRCAESLQSLATSTPAQFNSGDIREILNVLAQSLEIIDTRKVRAIFGTRLSAEKRRSQDSTFFNTIDQTWTLGTFTSQRAYSSFEMKQGRAGS